MHWTTETSDAAAGAGKITRILEGLARGSMHGADTGGEPRGQTPAGAAGNSKSGSAGRHKGLWCGGRQHARASFVAT